MFNKKLDLADYLGYHASSKTLPLLIVPTRLLQVFATPPQTLQFPSVNRLAKFYSEDVSHINFIFHGPYTTNMVRSRADTFAFTTEYIAEFYRLVQQFTNKLPLLVLHSSYPDKKADSEYSRKRFSNFFRALTLAIGNGEINLAIEASPCNYSTLTYFDSLQNIIDVESRHHISICFDTEHAYASGNDITKIDYNQASFWRSISVVHLNSLPKELPLGSGKDRHSSTPLIDAREGTEWIARLVKGAKQFGIPMILERGVAEIIESDWDFVKFIWDGV